jgi:hypothetical protein
MSIKILSFVFGALIISANKRSYADELKIHVIEPRFRIDWSSPRNLAITSGVDSARDDYAPIGHFAVEINCTNPNKYGIRHILTGMERQDKELSRQITLKKKLGLGSLIYPFKGALQTSKSSLLEMAQAKRDGRMKTISVPTSPARCDLMLDFLDNWIKSGSYQVYGGGKDVSRGEGAGCADFAIKLFEIATDQYPSYAWIVSIDVPKALIGDGKNKKVEFQDILARSTWANRHEPSMHFEIADTNLVFDWLMNKTKATSEMYQYTDHIFPTNVFYSRGSDLQKLVHDAANKMQAPEQLKPFTFQYETNSSPKNMWFKIRL